MKYMLIILSLAPSLAQAIILPYKIGECFESENQVGLVAKITRINRTTYQYDLFLNHVNTGTYKGTFESFESQYPDPVTCPKLTKRSNP